MAVWRRGWYKRVGGGSRRPPGQRAVPYTGQAPEPLRRAEPAFRHPIRVRQHSGVVSGSASTARRDVARMPGRCREPPTAPPGHAGSRSPVHLASARLPNIPRSPPGDGATGAVGAGGQRACQRAVAAPLRPWPWLAQRSLPPSRLFRRRRGSSLPSPGRSFLLRSALGLATRCAARSHYLAPRIRAGTAAGGPVAGSFTLNRPGRRT